MLHSKGPFTLTENSWSDTSIYDGSGRRVALLCIKHDCDENTQDEFEKRQAGDAGVMLEALNVHEATGLTPSRLQARVAELEAARVTLASEREVHVSVCSASEDELTKARDALRRLEVSANSVAYCYRHRPENFAGALIALEEDAAFAREATGVRP